jgi:hypothetical protein
MQSFLHKLLHNDAQFGEALDASELRLDRVADFIVNANPCVTPPDAKLCVAGYRLDVMPQIHDTT